MRVQLGGAALGVLLATGCVSDVDLGPLAAEIHSDPAVLTLGVGQTKTVIVEAFVGNEPQSVRWSIGMMGPGLAVVEDSTYGSSYVGNELVLPAQSHSRRFLVTMSDTVATSFVISGGTGIVTISVRPPVF
jgi:hypothetical protein